MRFGSLGPWLALGALSVAVPASAQQHVSFVTCPVAQDTGDRSDVCFFVRHEGERYGVSSPPDWGNPQLGHKLLVEGVVSEDGRECGGVEIEGRASVLPELSSECDEIAPATPEILALELGRRPDITEAQRAMILADPASSLQIMRLPALPVPEVALGRTETIYFPFERDRASGPDAMLMLELARLAEATSDVAISVRAFRGATLLDNGEILEEREDMARQRGEKIVGILEGLGAPEGSIDLEIVSEVEEPTGRADWQSRRAELRVSTTR
ncbi:hypothetical protein [Aurantiacibacter poecillastricola]|uniref:hypothetical protein n=1 Tax=Aurantiacibacter poecillastricola TaxID=3064385 RepID=UPI002740177D|nr:hypothetical protein [Aurantiacibacter sp. 219JJ12-13]MDP5263045.1 hypothetical protein [Aurantiacibacter sp. 219JJ12-13]